MVGDAPLPWVQVATGADKEADELKALCVGQSHDLSWTYNLVCPTEDEYLAMVDGSKFALRLLALLSQVCQPNRKRRNGRALQDAGENVGCKVQLAHQAGLATSDAVHVTTRETVPGQGRLHELDFRRRKIFLASDL